MDTVTILTERLRELPGIGPRQARRLAHWLLHRDKSWVESFAHSLISARQEIRVCTLCRRLFPSPHEYERCPLCTNHHRDTHTLLIIEKDVDLENIEKTGAYKGRYFVLGGTVSPLDKEPERKIRIRELEKRVQLQDEPVREIILALSATTEGEDTVLYLKEHLRDIAQHQHITITLLGRGLSTGTELEYVDADTLKSALKGRV